MIYISVYMYFTSLLHTRKSPHPFSHCSRFFTNWFQPIQAYFPSTPCMFHILPWPCTLSWLCSTLPCTSPWIWSLLSLYFISLAASFSIFHGSFFLWKLGQLLFTQSTHYVLQEVTYIYIPSSCSISLLLNMLTCATALDERKQFIYSVYPNTLSVSNTINMWSQWY